MIAQLNDILPQANAAGIPTLEQIAGGYKAKTRIAINENPKLFVHKLFRASAYLVEAAELFQNQILVDLGTGAQLDAYILAEIVGARAYVSVEARHMKSIYSQMIDPAGLRGANELNEIIREMSKFIITVKKYDQRLVQALASGMRRHIQDGAGRIPAVLLAEDMLTSPKRLPENSVSVLASGIDTCIHPEDDYSQSVEDEITRVLHPAGVYVGVYSRFQPKGLRNVTRVKQDWTFVRYIK